MKLRDKNKILIVLSLFVIYYSCKKEDNGIYPEVDIKKPTENQVFNVFDSVHIVASILHQKQLKNVSVAILRESMVPALQRFHFTPTGHSFELDTYIFLDDIELKTGTYYVNVRASDGINHTNAFKKIAIYEAPKTLEGAIIICKNTSHHIRLVKVDETLTPKTLLDIQTDFGYAGYEPISKRLLISGKYQSTLFCYDREKEEIIWQAQVPGAPPASYFQHLIMHNKTAYIALRNQAIIAYNTNGTLVYNLPTQNNMYPQHLLIKDNFLITSQASLSLIDTYIVIYYLSSNAFAQQLKTNLTPVALFSKDAGNFFFFANNLSGYARMLIYEIQSNNVWQPYALPQQKLKDALQIDSKTYLLAFENSVHRYTYQPNGMTLFVDNIKAVSMAYDQVNNQVWVATNDKMVNVYNYPFGNLVHQIQLTDSIKDIVLLFNK